MFALILWCGSVPFVVWCLFVAFRSFVRSLARSFGLFPVPVPEGEEPRPGLVGGSADGGLPVLVLLPDELVGGDPRPGQVPEGLFPLFFQVPFLLHHPAGLLLFREFRFVRRRGSTGGRGSPELGLLRGAAVGRPEACGDFALGRRDGGEDLQADGVADVRGRWGPHRQRRFRRGHPHQRGVQQQGPDGRAAKEPGLQLRVVRLEGPVLRPIDRSALGTVDEILQDDRQRFELSLLLLFSSNRKGFLGNLIWEYAKEGLSDGFCGGC